jgi:Na+-translocating ferredoxin:NAD+ oxidoreductase RNF subunit RnfB
VQIGFTGCVATAKGIQTKAAQSNMKRVTLGGAFKVESIIAGVNYTGQSVVIPGINFPALFDKKKQCREFGKYVDAMELVHFKDN